MAMEAIIREIQAKSILRKNKKIDSWFITRYSMNLYRGCAHNCAYCDGRAEKYNVDGEFGRDIAVKVNALEVLRRELDPARRRSPLKRSFVCLGGGVCDAYQPLEKKYELTRRTLELLCVLSYPVHILTKSTLVKRDADLIVEINRGTRALLSMSFSTIDEAVSSVFEPHVPAPRERLEILAHFKSLGIACGMFYMPVIPFISDTPEQMERVLQSAARLDLDYVIFGGMTLKPGRQGDYFLHVLQVHYPELVPAYEKLYPASKWGGADPAYTARLYMLFSRLLKKYGLKPRVPLALFNTILDHDDLVVVVLEHIDYLLKLKQGFSPYEYAAYALSQLKEPLAEVARCGGLRSVSGVGAFTEKIILEVLATRNCGYLTELLTDACSDQNKNKK